MIDIFIFIEIRDIMFNLVRASHFQPKIYKGRGTNERKSKMRCKSTPSHQYCEETSRQYEVDQPELEGLRVGSGFASDYPSYSD